MLKIKGLAAEDLNGFLDEGTEFSGRAALPRHVPDRRHGQGPDRLRQHAHHRGDRPGRRRDRLRGRLDPRAGDRPRARAPAHRAPRPAPACRRPSSSPQAGDRGRGVLPGGLPDGGPPEGQPPARGSKSPTSMVLSTDKRTARHDRRARADPAAHRARHAAPVERASSAPPSSPRSWATPPNRRPPRARRLHAPATTPGSSASTTRTALVQTVDFFTPVVDDPRGLRRDRRRQRALRRLRDGRAAAHRALDRGLPGARTSRSSGRPRSCAGRRREAEGGGLRAPRRPHRARPRDQVRLRGHRARGPGRASSRTRARDRARCSCSPSPSAPGSSRPRSRPGGPREEAVRRPRASMARAQPDRRRGGARRTARRAATDITGFGLVGHAAAVARESRLTPRDRRSPRCRSCPARSSSRSEFQAGGLKANRRAFEAAGRVPGHAGAGPRGPCSTTPRPRAACCCSCPPTEPWALLLANCPDARAIGQARPPAPSR